jgi:hypothetical protein
MDDELDVLEEPPPSPPQPVMARGASKTPRTAAIRIRDGFCMDINVPPRRLRWRLEMYRRRA